MKEESGARGQEPGAVSRQRSAVSDEQRGSFDCCMAWRTCLVFAVAGVCFWSSVRAAEDAPSTPVVESTGNLVLVIGAAGTPEYGEQFAAWGERWRAAAETGRVGVNVVGIGTETDSLDDRSLLLQALETSAGESSRPLWVVLIGHGTFDGRTAKFNLRGADLTSDDLAATLSAVKRPMAVVVCASGSGPFVKSLSAEGRVVVTATDGGGEINFSRFGDYLSRGIGDAGADLDKDDQVSLLEAFRVATSRTDEFYKAAGRIVTEHALLDDDGDGEGTRALELDEPGATDGRRAGQWRLVLSETELKLSAEQRAERDRLELALFELRDRKSQLPEDDYFAQLEVLLVQIAEIYEQAGALNTSE